MAKSPLKRQAQTISVLDIGSSKICCLIAHIQQNANLSSQERQNSNRLTSSDITIRGFGYQAAEGVRAGAIIDLEAVEGAVLEVVHQAEKMAGETIEGMVVNVSTSQMASEIVSVEVPLFGRPVEDEDIRRVLDRASKIDEPQDRELIHSIPVGYALDQIRGIRDPRGMTGTALGVNLHLISAPAGGIRNLIHSVGRCHLDIDMLVASPLASALACLVPDEQDLGATLIDMGGGTTTVAIFFDGHCVFADQFSVGGQYVTSDIARCLSTPIVQAERLKTLHGSCLATTQDELVMIDVPQMGTDTDDFDSIPRILLTQIIRPRLEETLEIARDRLEASGFSQLAGQGLVLTGGASQLQGVRELAQEIFHKQVRLGRPQALPGLGEMAESPEMATSIGMIACTLLQQANLPMRPLGGRGQTHRWLDRFGQWFKENF